MLKTYIAIMAAGAVGTGLRLWLSTFFAVRYGEVFPVGTLVINVTGCFIIAAFAALTGPEGRFLTSALARQAVMIGLLGGYTTFSSFGLQTMLLIGDGEWFRGGLYIILSVTLCLVAVRIGLLVPFLIHQN